MLSQNVRVDENCFASILNSQSVYTKSALKGENLGYEEKVVIITGGGIGRMLAMAYAEQGAKVLIMDKDADGLQSIRERLQAAGHDVYAYVFDLSNPTCRRGYYESKSFAFCKI
jgi:NADP-dependent 3-hydroxy acid dehydrogenase YdfG